MLKLYLIRHGETDWNADGRLQGHTDIDLNARGQEQARRLAARMTEEGNFSAIYSSPLRRTLRTAEPMSRALNLTITPDGRLLERSLGQLEGLTMSEIQQKFPEVHRAWTVGGARPQVPGEETREDFIKRVQTFLQDVRTNHPEGRVVVVTHGGTLGMLLMTSLNLDLEHPLPFNFDNASINIIQWGERRVRLHSLNDTCHLSHNFGAVSETAKIPGGTRVNAAEVQ